MFPGYRLPRLPTSPATGFPGYRRIARATASIRTLSVRSPSSAGRVVEALPLLIVDAPA
jgi:hypothetical protein